MISVGGYEKQKSIKQSCSVKMKFKRGSSNRLCACQLSFMESLKTPDVLKGSV